MNIQGVGQNSLTQALSQNSNPRLEAIEKQIYNLKKSIQEARGNEKLDPKTKIEKIKEYQDQIQMLQQEKTQIQAEERQSKFSSAKSKQPSPTKDTESEAGAINENTQHAFVKMDSAKKTSNALGLVREQAEGELRMAESKSYLRTPDPAGAAKAREKIGRINRFVMDKAAGIDDELNEASKEKADFAKDNSVKDESDKEKSETGTGRMEPGQFLSDEA